MYSFSFFAGIATLLVSPGVPSWWGFLAPGLLALAGALCWRRWRVARIVCGVCCGFLFAGWHAHEALMHRWPERLADERVVASVVVDSIPAPVEAGWAFDGIVRIERPERAPEGVSGALWGSEFRARLISRDAAVQPHAGERWR